MPKILQHFETTIRLAGSKRKTTENRRVTKRLRREPKYVFE